MSKSASGDQCLFHFFIAICTVGFSSNRLIPNSANIIVLIALMAMQAENMDYDKFKEIVDRLLVFNINLLDFTLSDDTLPPAPIIILGPYFALLNS